MKKILVLIFSLVALVGRANAYEECITKVTQIQPHKTNGIVWFKFADGTEIHADETSSGLERNMSVALAALMADKNLRVLLNDGQSCGLNAYENWSYIVAISDQWQ